MRARVGLRVRVFTLKPGWPAVYMGCRGVVTGIDEYPLVEVALDDARIFIRVHTDDLEVEVPA